MRFGLFYEHQLPRPWDPDSERRALTEALEQVELADSLGFDSVWEVEHHFLEEYSHSPAPEVFLAAASQRTSRIRLGHGIVQLPPPYNHPVRVAERIATLDLLSGGRVDFGTGTSSSQMELGGFGVPREDKAAMWGEALDAITRMFVEEPFAGYEGAHVRIPPRNVIPKPLQRPHPPLWMACSRRETIVEAGRRGLGALSFAFVEPEDARPWVDDYHAALASEACVPAGFSVNPNLAVVVPLMCHRDEATAIDRGIDGAHFFGYSLAHYYVFGEHEPGRTDVWEEFQRHRTEYGFARDIVAAEGEPLAMRLLEQGLGSLRGAVGTPEQVADLVERYERAGVDQVIFVAQAGRNRHEHVCESLELFAKEVLPRFAEFAEEREERKRDRLSSVVEAALKRRSPPRSAPAGYVVSAQGEPRPAEAIGAGASGTPSLRDRIQDMVDAGFEKFVRSRSDDQLETIFGRPGALRPLFRSMERRFDPAKALGFRGDVQYELDAGDHIIPWVVRILEDHVETGPGRSPKPTLVIRSSVATFLRIAARELTGAQAALEGHLHLDGDVTLAARLGEMFGQPSPY